MLPVPDEPKQQIRICGYTENTWAAAAMSLFLIATFGAFASLYFWVVLIPAMICLVVSGSLSCLYHLLCSVVPG
jgi:hypothetical protein